MILIGLSGYARSGKDTAAAVLVNNFGFTRVAFADKLREVLYVLNPVVDVRVVVHPFDDEKGRLQLGYEPQNIRVKEVIDEYGWDGYKETKYGEEIRRLLQRLGTEAGRQTLWDSIWVDAALNNLDPEGRYVVTDCRFPNEAQAILDKGGEVWRVSRRGIGPANAHSSENSLDGWDFDKHLLNDSTLEEFKAQIGHKAYDWIESQLTKS